jgi:hypothetical protein
MKPPPPSSSVARGSKSSKQQSANSEKELSRIRSDAMAEASRKIVSNKMSHSQRVDLQQELGDYGDFCQQSDLEEARELRRKRAKHKSMTPCARRHKPGTKKRSSSLVDSSLSSSTQDSRRYRNKLNPAVFKKAGLKRDEDSDDVISLSSSSFTEGTTPSPPRRRRREQKYAKAAKKEPVFTIPRYTLLRNECFRLINKISIPRERKAAAGKLYRELMTLNTSVSFHEQSTDMQVVHGIAEDSERREFSSCKTVICILSQLYGADPGDEGDVDDISINRDYDKL